MMEVIYLINYSLKLCSDVQLFALTHLFFSASPSIPITPHFSQVSLSI